MENRLWYRKPGVKWIEGLPLGNGHLGAMVLGGIHQERIALNEDTLWSGVPRDKTNYQGSLYLSEARELIEEGRYFEAQEIINGKMLSSYTESYCPLGDLNIKFFHQGEKYEDYRRELSLLEAMIRVNYKIKGINFKREIFISKPHRVMVIKFSADKPSSLSFDAALTSKLNNHIDKISLRKGEALALKGSAPDKLLPSYVTEDKSYYQEEEKEGTRFFVALYGSSQGGRSYIDGSVLKVRKATEVVLIISAATSFIDFSSLPEANEEERALSYLNDATNFDYKKLLQEHIEEYQKLYKRVSLALGDKENSLHEKSVTTDERLQRFREGKEDNSIITLYFNFGRYLLISSSRPGSEPANLQGIWNQEVRPPWSSNYTININTEMNYWPAEVCNLSECHEPLIKMIKELSIAGKRTAREEFKSSGWTANHNVDIWRYSNTVLGKAQWGYWPMGGPWLCHHLWEHYAFCKDKNFLQEVYPVLEGSAIFLLDWLQEGEEGYLKSSPSTSPENLFLDSQGRGCSVSSTTTMDVAIARNLFVICLKARKELSIEDESSIYSRLQKALLRLPPYKLNSYGGLQEWSQDYREAEPGHRHLSHLFGLYPGSDINIQKDHKLMEACRKTLSHRLSSGGGHTGWSCAWVINLYGRLKEGEFAYKYLNKLLKELTYENLLCVHPPFQIDGNFGGTAGIAELLLQSHEDVIRILPAIPRAWSKGSFSGLRARGGFTFSVKWTDNRLQYIKIKADHEGNCTLAYKNDLFCEGINCSQEIITLFLSRGEEYTLNMEQN